MSNIINYFLKKCLNCSCKHQNDLFCDTCLKKIKFIHKPICKKCGYPYPAHMDSCTFCYKMKFDKMRSIFEYEGLIKDHVVELKYNQKILNRFLFKKIIEKYSKDIKNEFHEYDFLVPVPINFYSYWQRGFNQAEVFASIFSKILGIKIINNLIKQKNNLRKQKDLNKKNRKNRSNRFFLNNKLSDKINNKNILIIDDVATTLGTVSEISSILKNHGIINVGVLTVARVVLKN